MVVIIFALAIISIFVAFLLVWMTGGDRRNFVLTWAIVFVIAVVVLISAQQAIQFKIEYFVSCPHIEERLHVYHRPLIGTSDYETGALVVVPDNCMWTEVIKEK